MAKIPFTFRELKNSWKESSRIAQVEARQNPHRLLLFYAVECGLKAAYLKQQNKDIIDSEIAGDFSHDINKLCTVMRLGDSYHLPVSLRLSSCKINNQDTQRTCGPSELNQVWRYGGMLDGDINNSFLEKSLEKVNNWLEEELS